VSEVTYPQENLSVVRSRTDWNAIWAGVFTFVAIWSVFGALGEAIFASVASPAVQQPLMGMSVGMGVWAIVLTAIAMYVAGRVTGSLAEGANRYAGVIHGMIMFGLSVISVIVITVLTGMALSGGASANGTAQSSYTPSALAMLGWIVFISLLLGWLAAMWGASSGIRVLKARPEKAGTAPVEEGAHRIRPVA
jgi:hypothetical protein